MSEMGFIKSNQKKKVSASILVPDTFTHSIAFGQTGCGKTTGFIYPNLEHRIKLGHGVLLYDYKGKEHQSVKFLAARAGRLTDVVEIGKPWGESINLLEKMDDDEFDKFLDYIIKNSPENRFWQSSAKSLGQSVLKILKAIESYASAMNEIDDNFLNKGNYISIGDYEYPKIASFKTFLEVCKSHENLGKFISELRYLDTHLEKITENSMMAILKNGNELFDFKDKYKKVLYTIKNVATAIEENINILNGFGSNGNKNLCEQIIGSLTGPLGNIAANKYFNNNTFDIVDALDQGKIVVVNTSRLSGAEVESLNNIMMYELSQRTRKININPISVFIDEAHRVINYDTDLPVDILREAKVDLFLVTQSTALLLDKLKDYKFNALMGNLTHKYYFQSSIKEDIDSNHDLGRLNTFEYISSSNDYENVENTTPIYITNLHKLNVEFKYQRNLKVLQKYLYNYQDKLFVLEYDARLFKKNKVIAIHIKTQEEVILNIANQEDEAYFLKEVNKFFETAMEKHTFNSAKSDEFDELLEEYFAS